MRPKSARKPSFASFSLRHPSICGQNQRQCDISLRTSVCRASVIHSHKTCLSEPVVHVSQNPLHFRGPLQSASLCGHPHRTCWENHHGSCGQNEAASNMLQSYSQKRSLLRKAPSLSSSHVPKFSFLSVSAVSLEHIRDQAEASTLTVPAFRLK